MIRLISRAAARSGLMTMSKPISRLSIPASRRYSGLRTRAMVCLAPSFLAIRQQTRLVSSMPVTAITRSAVRTPADTSTLMLAPLPCTHITSSVLSALERAGVILSTSVMSCFSAAIWRAMAKPTLPLPTMIIFMFTPLRRAPGSRQGLFDVSIPTRPR